MNIYIKLCAITCLMCLFSSCKKQTDHETTPIRKNIAEYVFASGSLEAENEYTLTALADGYLTEMNIKENDSVKSGFIVAVIDNQQSVINSMYAEKILSVAQENRKDYSPILQQAKEKVGITKVKMTYDSINLARHESLFKEQAIPYATYQSAELQYNNSKSEYNSAQLNYRYTLRQMDENILANESKQQLYQSLQEANILKVTKGGHILKKLKNVGDFVRKGEAIAVIGELHNVYARLNIDENSISKVTVGQSVSIKLHTLPGRSLKGYVSQILPTYDNDKQAFTAKVIFIEPPDISIVKTQLQANIEVGTIKNALLIPRKYLNYANQVYVKDNDEPITLSVGFVSTDWVHVISGINENTVLTLK